MKLVKAGYPHVKEGAGLAPWVLPEDGLNRTADEVGESGLLEVSHTLGLTEGVEQLLGMAPESLNVSPEAWQDAVKRWPPLSQVSAVVAAFIEVSGLIMAQRQVIKAKVDPMVICRGLAILLFAPFTDKGRLLLEEMSDVLGEQADDPADLIRSYADAVCRSDIPTLDKVNQCAVKYSDWQQWAASLQEQVIRCHYTPKLIGVTPPASAEIIGLLVRMIKEGQYDEPGRHYS